MQVTIMYRNNYDGGDGWTYFPMVIEISNKCPTCGSKRGKPKPFAQHEDGETYHLSVWENPCGHIDTYENVYHELLKNLKTRSA